MNSNAKAARRSSSHYFGSDSWQTRHDACLHLQREIATKLSNRDRLPRTSHAYANLTETILQSLKNLEQQVDALRYDLSITKDKSLTSGERARREGLVEGLVRSGQQLRFSIAQSSVSSGQRREERQRKELLLSDGGGIADLGDIQWGASTKKVTT